MNQKHFLTDIKKLRENAREKIDQGPITKDYSMNVKKVVELLNIVLATEYICTLRYKSHYYQAKSLGAKIASDEFLEHSQQEQEHAEQVAERISQLGGTPQMSPIFMVENSHSEYVECDNIADMINENLVAERIAIESYREFIKFIGNDDPTTRRILENILAVEEEHADDLLDLKAQYVTN